MSDEARPEESGPESAGARVPLPEPSFIMLAGPLHAQALMYLGEMAHGDEPPRVDLESAKYSIDLLGVLEEKTKGNLTEEEERFVRDLLFELRMKFVEASKAAAGG